MRLAQTGAEGWVTNAHAGRGLSTEDWWTSVEAAVRQFDRAVTDGGVALSPDYVRLLNIEEAAGRATSDGELLDLVVRAADLGFTDVVLAWPRPTMPYQGDESRMERLAAELPALLRRR